MASSGSLESSGSELYSSNRRVNKARRRHLRSAAVTVALTLLLPLAACSSSQRPSPPLALHDPGCTVGFPHRETVETSDPGEVKYLNYIAVCSNETSGTISLQNYSEMVWAFSDSFPAPLITADKRSPEVALFHTTFPSYYSTTYMVPGEIVTVNGADQSLSWAIHPDLSVAWTGSSFILKKFNEYGMDALDEIMAEGSPTHQAFWDCTHALYDTGAQVHKTLTTVDYDPLEQLKNGWDLSNSAGTCATSWKSAARESRQAKIPPWSAFTDDAYRALEPGAGLSTKMTGLKAAVVETGKRICLVLRGC